MKTNLHAMMLMACSLAAIAPMEAQISLSHERNGYRIGDSIVVSTVPEIPKDASGKDALWELSGKSAEGLRITRVEGESGTILLDMPEASYIYKDSKEGLLLTSFENLTTRMAYREHVRLQPWPFAYGDSASCCFSAEGMYCDKIHLQTEGAVSAKADGWGSLVLDGDTIKDVMRVHRRTLSVRHGSEDPFEAMEVDEDRIRCVLDTAASKMVEDRWLWYAPDCRYPVLESVLMRSSYGYDAVGRLSSVARQGSCGQLSYRYNVRGWIESIAGPAFSATYRYTEGLHGQFSSLISGIQWIDNYNTTHFYDITYDELGRYKRASYTQPSYQPPTPSLQTTGPDYSETGLTYNSNGSLLGFKRKYARKSTFSNNFTNQTIDDVELEYDGNQVVRATDNAGSGSTGSMGFKDGASLDVEYHYNGNGALIADANKGISLIEYDDCGFPRLVQFANGCQTHYVYAPDGTKLKTKHLTAVDGVVAPLLQSLTLTSGMVTAKDSTEYVGDYVLQRHNPKMCLFDGGYFEVDDSIPGHWKMCFYTKDHLGNNRAVVDEFGKVLQAVQYYPSGLPMTYTGIGEQPYLFNGKEYDSMHALNLYDYGFRSYDPAQMSWTSVDPLASKYPQLSPYSYCAGDPINFIDNKGDSIAVLNVGGDIGHSALLIQNGQKQWEYFSHNGTWVYSSSIGSSGGKGYHDLGTKTFESPEAFLESSYNLRGDYDERKYNLASGYNFNELYIVPTSEEQDLIIKDAFIRYSSEGYNLKSNQCAQVVYKSLLKGGVIGHSFGIKTFKDANDHKIKTKIGRIEPYWPKDLFKNVMKYNEGKHVAK